MSTITTRVSRFVRYWACPVCGWRATISTKKHFQTGQPLTRAQQIGALEYDASQHFRAVHRDEFVTPKAEVTRR